MSNNLITINNQFLFNFPTDFVPEEIEKRYMGYIKSKRKLHLSVLDYLNSTVLDISFPSITFNQVTNKQNLHRKQIGWKAVDNINDLFDDSVTITIQDVNSKVNYMIFLDVLSNKYLNSDAPYDENILVTIVDENRNALYQIQFREVIWMSQDGTRLGFNNQSMGSDTFTISFTYNFLDIRWLYDGSHFIDDNIK